MTGHDEEKQDLHGAVFEPPLSDGDPMHILFTAVAIGLPSVAVITKLVQLERGRRLRRRLAEWNSYEAEQQRRRALETNAHMALECGVFDVVTPGPECDHHEAEQETVVAA